MKNTLDMINRLDTTKENISEHEYIAIEIIQRKHREERSKKMKGISVSCGTILSGLIYV